MKKKKLIIISIIVFLILNITSLILYKYLFTKKENKLLDLLNTNSVFIDNNNNLYKFNNDKTFKIVSKRVVSNEQTIYLEGKWILNEDILTLNIENEYISLNGTLVNDTKYGKILNDYDISKKDTKYNKNYKIKLENDNITGELTLNKTNEDIEKYIELLKKDKIKKEDKEFFDNYLSIFLPSGSANNFTRTIDKFTNEDITKYLLFYYIKEVNSGALHSDQELNGGEYTGIISYTTTKEELDKIVYKYFGISDYEIIENDYRMGIKKLKDNTYQIYWFATGFFAPEAENISVIYNDNLVEVKYKLSSLEGYDYNLENNILTFNLLYNGNSYIVKSIVLE